MSRTACTILIAVVAAIVLSGCGEATTPRDIEVSEKLCKEFGGVKSIEVQLGPVYRFVQAECNDSSTIKRHQRKGTP